MSILRDALGAERYEEIRNTIAAAFPGPDNQIDDELVDAFIHELQRRSLPGIERLGLPEAPRDAEDLSGAPSYPLYVAHAYHDRVRAMDSAKPFSSSFVGHLPTVRVAIPQALDTFNTRVQTSIGVVDFARDHLAGSVELVGRLFGEQLGYTPARVDLVTPARRDGVRFAAVAVYLGYREADDKAPSFYVLEAGLATGQPAMLYLGKTMDGTIVEKGGYVPTPFASADNTYRGSLVVKDDQPVELVVQSSAPGLPYYIQVTVSYEPVTTAPGTLPLVLMVEAVERIAAIGKGMDAPTGMPKLVEDILAAIALHFLSWIEKPGAAPAPRGAPGKITLRQRLTQIGEDLVSTFQPIGEGRGRATAHGLTLEMPETVKDRIATLLEDLRKGREGDLAERLAQLDGDVVVKQGGDRSILPNGAQVVAAMVALAVGSGPDGSTTGTGQRQTWANQLANQRVQPLSLYRPASLDAAGDATSVGAVLRQSLATGCAVKAAGSGHSYSDVATTPDLFIDTHGLNRVAGPESPITGQLSPSMLRPGTLPLALGPIEWPGYDPEKHRAFLEMEAGITIRDLNPVLDRRNLGLINMGGYDGQTIIGATSTSTHGSGLSLGPFPDMVRSLVIATTGRWKGPTTGGGNPKDGVYFYRIEPKNGITDPAKYDDPQIALIQDDDCFHATICSMGCFGVIYSVVIEVMQAYWLSETRYETSLAQVMADLAPDRSAPDHAPAKLRSVRNYEVLIQPYPMKGLEVVTMDPGKDPAIYYRDFNCIVTERVIAPKPASPPKPRPTLPDWLSRILAVVLDLEPWLTPEAINISLCTLRDKDYVNRSYQIYNLGLGGGVGFAAEVGFSLDGLDGKYTDRVFKEAIDRIHKIAQTSRVTGQQYQTSAFSLRFVKRSDALLSMMEGRNTAMIEMDMLTGTYAGAEIMYRYESAMYALGGRPHWGLDFDNLTGNDATLHRMYPKLGAWLGVYRQLNERGTFDNAFTRRMGFASAT